MVSRIPSGPRTALGTVFITLTLVSIVFFIIIVNILNIGDVYIPMTLNNPMKACFPSKYIFLIQIPTKKS